MKICPYSFILQNRLCLSQLIKKLNSRERGALFRHFCVSKDDHRCACAQKWCHISFFPRDSNKKIKGLRPKITKIDSSGGPACNVTISVVFYTNNAKAPSLFSNVTSGRTKLMVHARETVSGNSALLQSNGMRKRGSEENREGACAFFVQKNCRHVYQPPSARKSLLNVYVTIMILIKTKKGQQ